MVAFDAREAVLEMASKYPTRSAKQTKGGFNKLWLLLILLLVFILAVIAWKKFAGSRKTTSKRSGK